MTTGSNTTLAVKRIRDGGGHVATDEDGQGDAMARHGPVAKLAVSRLWSGTVRPRSRRWCPSTVRQRYFHEADQDRDRRRRYAADDARSLRWSRTDRFSASSGRRFRHYRASRS